jgi:hypothetical protein
MITKITITNKDKEHYLYNDETKILLKMLNNGISILHVLDKCFVIKKTGSNTATIKISKVKTTLIFFKTYNLKTTLKIKYN